ncbi:hypothetical protein [Lichenibacterium dinghuense]|nr:hypothetical protein [Lichenibacterium sp. 6Y81]
MRFVPVAAVLLGTAALAFARAATVAPEAALPVWALFTFAVSAFREPLR